MMTLEAELLPDLEDPAKLRIDFRYSVFCVSETRKLLKALY